nr:MAG TPA: hypothetical protein [Caudoviricetes sp.]
MLGYICRAYAENRRKRQERLFDSRDGGKIDITKERRTPGGEQHGI